MSWLTLHLKSHVSGISILYLFFTKSEWRPYICKLCSVAFKIKSHLKQHEEIHKKNVKFSVSCLNTLCNRTFKSIALLTKHTKTHLSQKTIYTCGECSKVFKRADLLATHQRVHTGLKPFQCDAPTCFCVKFQTKGNHDRHMRK